MNVHLSGFLEHVSVVHKGHSEATIVSRQFVTLHLRKIFCLYFPLTTQRSAYRDQ